MLPKAHRLSRQADFRDILKERKGFREDGLFLKAKKRKDSSLRFGIVVGKNVSAKATARNRFRRIVAEGIAKILSHIQEGYDIVVIGLPKAHVGNLEEAQALLEKLFRKASLFKTHS